MPSNLFAILASRYLNFVPLVITFIFTDDTNILDIDGVVGCFSLSFLPKSLFDVFPDEGHKRGTWGQ